MVLNFQMSDAQITSHIQLTRFFEKLVSWLGLSENAGPVLAVMFLERYEKNEKLSAEEICVRTGYSRANTGLIISQLEALGIILGQRDYSQKGRGRRRVLYTLSKETPDLIDLGVKRLIDSLETMVKDVKNVQKIYEGGKKNTITKMLKSIQKEIENRINKLRDSPIFHFVF